MISLVPLEVTEQTLKILQGWAENPDMQNYFRRFPAAFTWNSVNTASAMFQNHFWILDEGLLSGVLSLTQPDHMSKKVELGMIIVSPGEGIGSRALKHVANLVFTQLGMQKITCRILDKDARLKRTLLHLGFELEGSLKRELFWKNEFHDEAMLSLFKKD